MYHYDIQGNLLLETSDTGVAQRSYVWLESQPIVQVDTTPTGETLTYLHTDHLSTPRVGTDDTGKVVWRWEGEAFGATLPNDDPDADGTTTTVNLRFPGQYYDQESGLHYNGYRYYDPELGRYITSDPIGLWGGLNTYSYVTNNPLRWVDPDGLNPWSQLGIAPVAQWDAQAEVDAAPQACRDVADCAYECLLETLGSEFWWRLGEGGLTVGESAARQGQHVEEMLGRQKSAAVHGKTAIFLKDAKGIAKKAAPFSTLFGFETCLLRCEKEK